MDVYIARQPIFDRRMNLYGYELFYRKSEKNYYEGTDAVRSTVSLINDAFLVFGVGELLGDVKGFINFPQELLLDNTSDILPRDQIVIELLETVEPTEEVLLACKDLRKKGFAIALDDFVLERDVEKYLPLIALANIVKVEFPALSGDTKGIERIIKALKKRVAFLAEKVETREDYERAKELGFDLFQGYFFSKPVMSQTKDVGTLNANLLRIVSELYREEPQYTEIANIIRQDVGLSYKFLKIANSAFYGAGHRIESIEQGLLLMGLDGINRWVHLMLLRGVERPENMELIKTCVIRGRILSRMAQRMEGCKEADYFIAGMFSSIDILLETDMERALSGLMISDVVRDALLGKDNLLRRQLLYLQALERGDFESLHTGDAQVELMAESYVEAYMEAVKWQREVMR